MAERRIKGGGERAGKVKYTFKVSKLECHTKDGRQEDGEKRKSPAISERRKVFNWNISTHSHFM